jgi:hemerythrin
MTPPIFPWTDAYAIGHAELDAEHRRLVEAINQICDIEHTGEAIHQLGSLLPALTIAAVEHFKHENALMRELSCLAASLQADRPVIADILGASAVNEHCAEHARALLQLESLIRDNYPGADAVRGRLGKMLMDWFTEHALHLDADLRIILRAYFTEISRAAAATGA